MVESFYTYLHGPRTFWGGSGRTSITNNFYGGNLMPSYSCMTPLFNFGFGGCGCNKTMNNLLGFMVLNQMINNLPFQYSQESQEGAGGSDQNLLSQNSQNLLNMQNMMDKLGFTSANGYSVAQNADGSLLFTYNKDGKTIVASSLPELMGKVNNTSTQSEQASDNTSLEDSLAVHKPDKADNDNDDDKVDNDADNASEAPATEKDEATPTDSDTPTTPDKTKRKTSRHHMPNLAGQKIGGKELEWKGYNKIDSNTDVGKYIKNNIKNGTTLDRLVNVMLPRATKEERAKYKQWIIDGNPNGIKDGKVVDVNKLDLPVYKTQSANTGHTKTVKGQNGCLVKYSSDGTPTYYINNTKVSETEFMDKDPQTYFKTKKSYKRDELVAAITKYNSTIGGNKLKNIFITSTNNQNIIIKADYKGNGLSGYYSNTVEFPDSKTNQTINRKMENIYKELIDKYDSHWC